MLLSKVTSTALLSITQLMISDAILHYIAQKEHDTKTVKTNYELICGFDVLGCRNLNT
jgi:hypothetical protein